MKTICLFCGRKMKREKTGYGLCSTCKISILKEVKKPEYTVMVKDKDVKLVNDKLTEELKKKGYNEIR